MYLAMMQSPDLVGRAQKFFKLRAKQIGEIEWSGSLIALAGTSPDDPIPLCEAVAPDASEKGNSHGATRIQSHV